MNPKHEPEVLLRSYGSNPWKNESFLALVKQRSPYTYCAVRMFGEPSDGQDPKYAERVALQVINDSIPRPPPDKIEAARKLADKLDRVFLGEK